MLLVSHNFIVLFGCILTAIVNLLQHRCRMAVNPEGRKKMLSALFGVPAQILDMEDEKEIRNFCDRPMCSTVCQGKRFFSFRSRQMTQLGSLSLGAAGAGIDAKIRFGSSGWNQGAVQPGTGAR